METRRGKSISEGEFQNQGSWIPGTPLKPVGLKPPPIYANARGGDDQLEQANWSEPRGFPFLTSREFEAYLESNKGIRDWEVPLAGRAQSVSRDAEHSRTNRASTSFANISFRDQLALANARSTASTSGISSPFMSSLGFSHVTSQNNCAEEMPQYGPYDSYWHSYDLDSVLRTVTDPIFSEAVSTILPDKSRKVEIENVSSNGQAIEEGNKDKGVATAWTDKELERIVDSPEAAVSTLLEDHNPDKGDIIDLNKTPQQQKQRRRKHRPKVVIEGKPKRIPKTTTSNPTGPKEPPTGRRNNARRNTQTKPSASPPTRETEGVADPETVEEPRRKSCRRTLNFDSDGRVRNVYAASSEETLTVRDGEGTECVVENTGIGASYDLNLSKNKIVKDNSVLPRRLGSSVTQQETSSPQEKLIKQYELRSNYQTVIKSPNHSNCSTSASPSNEIQGRGLKREHSHTDYQSQFAFANSEGAHYRSLHTFSPILNADECRRIAGMHFPEIYKKKRTEKVTYSMTSSTLPSITRAKMAMTPSSSCQQNDRRANVHASNGDSWISNPQFNSSRVAPITSKNTSDKTTIFQCMPIPSLPERSTKKRTKGHTRVRDLASLNGILCFKEPDFATCQEPAAYGGPNACIEALVAETRAIFAKKKRSKKRTSVLSSMPWGTDKGQLKELNAVYDHQQFFTKSKGSLQALQSRICPIDALVEQLKHLNINNQSAYQDQHVLVPYNARHQEQNALVLYRRDGTIVPFEGSFNPLKKRRPRPKVDLDEETTRVWQLLMANINSEGIDGTNEQKEKWWEEERRVFHGRADSFIARMRLVQGDRRFSPWKGSVLDSVIGVFLTQNVSDHLSSSAFMSLAAHFPLKSKGSQKTCHEEKNPEICDLNNFESCEDKEVANSSELFGSSSGGVNPMNNPEIKVSEFCESAVETNSESMQYTSSYQVNQTKTNPTKGEGRLVDDEILSQNSVVSSQNSTNSSIRLTGERVGSCSDSNSEAEELSARSKHSDSDASNPFVEFLRMAGVTVSPEVHSQGESNVSLKKNSEDAENHSEYPQYDQLRHSIERLNDPKNFMGSSVIHCSNAMPNSEILEVERFKVLEENSVCEEYELREACTSQATVQKKPMVNLHEVTEVSFKNNYSCKNHESQRSDITQSDRNHARDKEKLVESSLASDQNEKMQQYHVLKNFPTETSDGTESTSKVYNQKNIDILTAETKISSDNSLDVMESNTSSGKRHRVRKAQEKAYNWDNLRKEAQANGKKRERTTNTMDSLDWEAVRCADVNEIANTIKERGMNNMLAERIKAFLNRLVAEHESIDLEWLRDVPPDKAKEYLLSVRGLGLKSVECVRLLTLHQLAFPVDTNVGRIAVRLGWVPLQPLPESLQLHLLELYPVLESIQKYLWPRLCKLDQRTLYELHYQMITFGKVFCTKSKPNCNACPMRGECRHFASAFASARLALPGPEEKSIVSTTESRSKEQGPADIFNSLPLPLPQLSLLAESKSESGICKPIIEEPATPEPECTPEAATDIEDTFCEDPNEIPTIKLNIEEFTQNLHNYMQKNMELQEGEMSKALVSITPEAASIPMPKLKNVNRLRTEHQVYELPDSHPLLDGLDEREPDDPCSYLLAIWTPGETANSIQAPEGRCNFQEHGKLCDQKTCFSCNSIKEANSQIVRGTLLIPCRTAMRGSFPLNGTYFQVNEVFADHDSSLNPIDIPRSWIWNLPRRTVYFGTSIPTIFKGLSTEGIQHCFWRGYVCVRGFDQKTRAPRPLMARLHFPASKLTTRKGDK